MLLSRFRIPCIIEFKTNLEEKVKVKLTWKWKSNIN